MSDRIEQTFDDSGIAVIGMSGRFPGARNLREFWNNLRDGRCSAVCYSDEELLKAGVDPSLINKKNYVKVGYPLENGDCFDASFFGYTPREAECIDPQHRVFLECAWATFEDAGYNPETYPGLVGLFAGCGTSNYWLKNLSGNQRLVESVGDFELTIDNDKDYLTTRVSYKMNLKGPSINVQSACSTSLVAVCLGFQSLMTYQCDMALCGGVSLTIPPKQGYLYKEGMIHSPDGYCRAFDADSNGTVLGEGVGAVLLKRLDEAIRDNDHIYAVIKGAAINNDGSLKAGYTAPSTDGQAMAIEMAQRLADVSPETISYVETHGTGTPLGDPIEIAALTKVFRKHTEKTAYCAIGSVKTNIGHLDAAAGIAGFIKTVLALHNKQIPPSLHFEKPNPRLNLESSPFYVNTALREWPVGEMPKRAGVSSFGIGGTNAHVVLEEASPVTVVEPVTRWMMIPLSAKNESSLIDLKLDLGRYLRSDCGLNIADMAYTFQTGRKMFDHRSVITCRDRDDLVQSLESGNSRHLFSAVEAASSQRIVFMFTGQGSQHVGMSSGVYCDESVFRENVDYCSERIAGSLGFDLRDVLYPKEGSRAFAEDQLAKTSIVQPALFVMEYALAKLWMSWGIAPAAFIGHSIGEYVAACLSGVFSLDDALEIVTARGQMIQALPSGSMLSVPLSEKDLGEYLADNLWVAVVNGESLCVVSGETGAIKSLETRLHEHKITSRILQTSHAFHSGLVASVCEPFVDVVKKYHLMEPSIPYVSNVTGTWIRKDEAADPDYYGKHLRRQVKFYHGAKTLIDDSYRVFLEVGPANTLCSMLHRIVPAKRTASSFHSVPSLAHPLEKTPDGEMLARALGKLWLAGAEMNWDSYYSREKRNRLPLPSYTFQKKRYWVDPPVIDRNAGHHVQAIARNVYDVDENQELLMPAGPVNVSHIEKALSDIWSEVLGMEAIDKKDSFFDMGGNSLMATQLIALINERLNQELTLTDFFFDPTISGLIGLISHDAGSVSGSGVSAGSRLPVLFPIQPRGGNLPLFIVAGAHENRYYDPVKMKSSYEDDFLRYLSNLVPHLGKNQPVYGFRPKGLVATESPHSTVEEMAASYIKEIRRFQPEGPYLIAGECVGGIVAYEMARQLIVQNQKVAHLIMMDTHCPSLPFALNQHYLYIRRKIMSTIRASIDCWKKNGPGELLAFLGEKIRSVPMLFFPVTKKLRLTRQIMLRGYEYQKTLFRYRPVPFEVDATLLLNEEWYGLEPDMGWKDALGRFIKIVKVPGNHLTRLTTYGDITGGNITEIIKTANEKCGIIISGEN